LREDFGKSTKEELGEDRRERERERDGEREMCRGQWWPSKA
jgi:hypothetical protein